MYLSEKRISKIRESIKKENPQWTDEKLESAIRLVDMFAEYENKRYWKDVGEMILVCLCIIFSVIIACVIFRIMRG